MRAESVATRQTEFRGSAMVKCRNEELAMTKVEIDQQTADQIRHSDAPIELVDSNGQSAGVVRRAPTQSEIERAKQRASHGGATLTWDQVRTMLRQDG